MKKILRTALTIFILQGTLMSATLKYITYHNTNIPVIFEDNTHLPIFNLQLVFTNGGYISDKELPGITNIVSKILDEGTLKEGAVSFARKLENNAIAIDIHNGFETFVIEVSCLETEYPLALQFLGELLANPNLSEKSLEKIKTLQSGKLKQKENDFDFVASSNLKQITYAGTPLAFPSAGTLESIEKIKLQEVKKHLESLLNLDNLIIATGGSIDFEKFQHDIQTILAFIHPQGKNNFEKIAFSTQTKEEIIKKETEQSYIYFSSPFDIEADSKENYKAKVASFILGGSGFGSRMMEEIRVKHGLAYSAYGQIKNQKSHSHFGGYLQTKLDNTQKAKEMVISIVKEFSQNGVTQEELDAAKKFLTGSEPLRTETFSQRLSRAFNLYYNHLPFDYPKQELEKINTLTLEELNHFIQSHPEIQNLSFSIVTK